MSSFKLLKNFTIPSPADPGTPSPLRMDVLFGSTTQEEHDRYVAAAQKTADSNALYRGDGLNYAENEKKEEEIEHKERV